METQPMVLPMPKLKKWEADRVAFFGPMASGKSYIADYLVREHHYTKVSFAAKLKGLAYELYGVQSKDGDGRALLQGLGSDLRKYDPDVWIKYALATMKNLEGDTKIPAASLVLDDLRYENEGKALKANGFTLIQIQASEEVRSRRLLSLYPGTPSASHNHPSEQEWRRIKPDYILLCDEPIAKHDIIVYLDSLAMERV